LGPARLIVNPAAGNGQIGSVLPRLTAALRDGGLEFDVAATNDTADTSRLARAALDEGIRYLIAVGGDGTVHHVVNGMFEGREAVAEDAVLGVCATGTGSDFVRNFGLNRSVDVVAGHLLTEHTMAIDVGVAQYTGFDGNRAECLFANIAEVGYGAEVVRRAARLPKRLGRVRYLLAAWASMARMPRANAKFTVDFTTRTVPLVELVAANGQFFGGGMKVAPRAIPQDGRLSVLAFTGTRNQVFLLTTKLFAGEHLPHPEIVEYQSSTCTVSTDQPMLVEADGELLGTTPARFSLLKRVLQLKI
jgi:YegS/Rv2252/BmrU family lipid kinase